ncbi:MAG: TIGR00730 family Rossman fold protein, partial [Geminicoccaceae bacterium]
DQAARLGELCGQNAIEVVYGGGHVGLMGVVADAAMAAGGRVTGLIPERLLDWEVGHRGISELIVTNDMFDRKDQMIAKSDAFAILPGGLGTLDEFFEVLTLRQLGYHQKPIILVNVDGFWDPLNSLIQQVVDQGFADADIYSMLHSVDSADAVLPALGIGEIRPISRAEP